MLTHQHQDLSAPSPSFSQHGNHCWLLEACTELFSCVCFEASRQTHLQAVAAHGTSQPVFRIPSAGTRLVQSYCCSASCLPVLSFKMEWCWWSIWTFISVLNSRTEKVLTANAHVTTWTWWLLSISSWPTFWASRISVTSCVNSNSTPSLKMNAFSFNLNFLSWSFPTYQPHLGMTLT